jgi:hypothetical protein
MPQGTGDKPVKRVVIESPLNDVTEELIQENLHYARRCLLDSLRRGEAPYASHVLFHHKDLLNDLRPDERRLGMEAGFTWGKEAELVAVYTDRGISRGMQAGIDTYRHRGIPVEMRTLRLIDLHS